MTTITQEDRDSVAAIQRAIPGWSDMKQYAFFKDLLAAVPTIRDVLILGVYYGRDIAFLLDVCARYHPERELNVLGVDKFSAEPCDDWPKDKRGMTWEQAGFGPAPSFEKALHNVQALNHGNRRVALVQRDASAFLCETKLLFDVVYEDTSHDYETCKRIIQLAPNVTRGDAIIAGDDYSDAGTWGVKRAVTACFNSHHVFADWIWYSNKSELKA